MATKKLKSLKGRRMRLTRLDACGAPVVGACSSIVTDGFITVGWTPNVEAGQEYLLKNAWGDFCVNEKDEDRIKWVDVAMSFCEVHPDVLDFVAGMNPITDGTDTIGASLGTSNGGAAFALEVWTKQAGGDCEGSTPEWGYWLGSFCKNGGLDGQVLLENNTLTIGLKGEVQQAVADWGVNPYDDNPLITAAGMPVGDFIAVVRTTVQPPAVTAGCVALS